MSLFSISSTLNSFLNPPVSAAGKKSKREYLCCKGNFIATPHQLSIRMKNVFFFYSIFFVFIFWCTETTAANFQIVTHLTPLKSFMKKRRFRSFLIKWYINRYYILFSYGLNKNTSSCLN